ncbi:MAG: DUF3710 domain-containing protein [Candidatus Nanopelagicales bacterium]
MSSESHPDPRAAGPWDVTEVDGVDTRMDFGSLWIRGVDGLQVQAQMDDATKVVGLITLTLGSGAVQVQVFAAPRTAGLWDDVRSQLASSVTSQGGVIEEGEGEFGVELRGRVPGQGGLQSVRFVGVDGPRWFLRGLFLGDAAPVGGSPELEGVFRDIVVNRGIEAMAPGEALMMTLPVAPDPVEVSDPADP